MQFSNAGLLLGAGIAAMGALIHVAIVIGGPDWYAFFQAPPAIVDSARRGTWVAPAVTLLIAAVMALCAIYALSGASLISPLPLQRIVLAGVALVCILRALATIALAVIKPELLTGFEVIASLIFLTMGIAYAVGLYSIWNGRG